MKVTLKVEDLNAIFNACKSFVSKGSLRPILSMIHLSFSNGQCTAYALDGIKLMSIVVPCNDDEEGMMNIPIIKLPKEVFVIIKDEEKDIVFEFPGGKQIIRKCEGEYLKEPGNFFNDIETKQKQNFSIGFKVKNLKDALNGFKGDEVISIDFYGEVNPCIMKCENKKALVFPFKLKRG